MKTLGICIPAYKRPQFLGRCIESALAAAQGHPIQIVVADDSVDDTNVAVMQSLLAKHPWMEWHRNPVNLGIDANIQHAVDLCRCDYAWLIGEDDTFLPGAIPRLLERLQTNLAPFVMANYAYVGDNNQTIGHALNGAPASLELESFLTHHLWSIDFLGACVIDRARWASTSALPYEGTYYSHVGRICELLVQADRPVPIEAVPCVANRVEGTDTFTWKRDSYGVFFGYRAMCQAVAHRCPAQSSAMGQAILAMQKRYGWLTLRLAMRLRSERGYDVAQYRKYLHQSTTNPVKRACFWLISLTPPAVFVPPVWLYRKLRPIRPFRSVRHVSDAGRTEPTARPEP
jgi:glycosyltransferase involved in cell wall biosynthesis